MAKTSYRVAVEIAAPPEIVWAVMANVTCWPEWTPSVSRLKLLTSGPLRVGSRARVHQPKLPPAWWRVTEILPGHQFTWVSTAPGVRVTARHAVEANAGGSRVTLSVRYEGLFGALLARMTHSLNERYLAMEAKGLKDYCERCAATPELRTA